MGRKCAPRKQRKHPLIKLSSKYFSKALEVKDYKEAAEIVFSTGMVLFGKEGMMNAMEEANSYMKRKKLRRDEKHG